MTIKMTWESGEVDKQLRGRIVYSNNSHAPIGSTAIIDYDFLYEEYNVPLDLERRGPVLRLPEITDDTFRISNLIYESGMPSIATFDVID